MKESEEIEILHSKKNMLSFGFGGFAREFISMAFNTFVFFFYENEVKLDVWLVGIAYIIFAIYNMFNDPMLGWLTNRPFKFTKKWGRRFPWLLIGGLPWGFTYVMIFTPPIVSGSMGPLVLFIWLLVTICLFDTFHSLYFVNFSALFADKFRSVKERRTASGIEIAISVVGVALGAMLPPLFVAEGVISSYTIQGMVVFLVCFIGMLLAIPGFKEDKELIERYLKKQEEKREKLKFFHSLKTALKQKSFLAFIIVYTMYQTLVVCMTNSIPYTVQYILGMPLSTTTIIFAGFLIGVLIATPIWVFASHKTNDNRKLMIITGLLMVLTTAPLMFVGSLTLTIIVMVFWGMAQGGFWFLIFPVLSDTIDDSVVLTGERREGIYTGFQQFFGRIGIVIQALSFAIAHELTGYVEGAATQTPLAIWGIRVHLALAPMLFILFGTLIFWKFYKLTPDKVRENKIKIKDLGL